MSWSISIIGKPENVAAALKNHSAKLSGVSKEEYDAALPHIEAIVNMNFNKDYPFAIKVEANGHAYKDEKNNHSQCNVSVTVLNGELV